VLLIVNICEGENGGGGGGGWWVLIYPQGILI